MLIVQSRGALKLAVPCLLPRIRDDGVGGDYRSVIHEPLTGQEEAVLPVVLHGWWACWPNTTDFFKLIGEAHSFYVYFVAPRW